MHTNVKRLIVGCIAGLALAAGGAWYAMAGTHMDSTRAFITRINAKQLAGGTTVKITYDSLARTTFPAVGVRLVNPAIELNSPGITADPAAGAATAPQPFHLVWKHTGTVDIITDYLAHAYRLVNDGSGTGSLDSRTEKVSISSAPAHSEMTLTAKSSGAFSQWQSLDLGDQAAAKVISQIGGVELNAGPMKITDTTTNAAIMAQEEAKLKLVNRSNDAKIDFELSLLSKGSEVTKEYTDFVMRAATILNLPTAKLGGAMPMSAARAGKQDVAVNLSATMPTPNGQPYPKGTIHMTKFSIKNDFYALDAPFDIVMDEDAIQRHASIKVNWLLDISPAGAREMQLLVDQGMPWATMLLGGAGKDADPVVLKQKIFAALPTVSTLGPIHLTLDVDANMPKNAPQPTGATTPTAQESVTLRNFSFGHKRWGIEARGDASGDTRAAGATIHGTLTCKHCTTLTQDIFETINASQEVMVVLQPGVPTMPFTEAALTQLNTTLAEIGRPGTALGDLDFLVTTGADKNVLLNDKPIGEALQKLMMAFMPQQPADQQPPAPVKQEPAPGAPAL